MKKIIACDLGGTNVRFGLFSYDSGLNDFSLTLEKTKFLKTEDFSSFEELFLAAKSFDLADRYSFAVAGPVFDGLSCQPPNIKWRIELTGLKEKVFLLNDFVAQAWALTETLKKSDIPVAIVGAGTGLGKAVVVNSSDGPYVMASEGGHSTFSFLGEDELQFSSFACERLSVGSLVCDDIVSGRGLELLYEFLEGKSLAAEQINLNDSSSQVFNWFARMYGRVCRNFVLDTFALGGLVVSGGIAINNPGLISSESFRESFVDSAHYGYFLEQIPIQILPVEDAGLWGASRYVLSVVSA